MFDHLHLKYIGIVVIHRDNDKVVCLIKGLCINGSRSMHVCQDDYIYFLGYSISISGMSKRSSKFIESSNLVSSYLNPTSNMR